MKKTIHNFETEVENLKKEICSIERENLHLKQINESYDLSNKELNSKIDEIKSDYNNITSLYQNRLDMLDSKLLNQEVSNGGEFLDFILFKELIAEELKDLSSGFQVKMKNMSNNITASEGFIAKSEEIISNIIKDKSEIISSTIQQMMKDLNKENEAIKDILINNSIHLKTNERFEWLMQQITELVPFKLKSMQFQEKMEKLETKLSLADKKISNYKELDFSKGNLIKEQERKINKLNGMVKDSEAKLSDIKDFIFKHCFDKLDEFSEFYSCF